MKTKYLEDLAGKKLSEYEQIIALSASALLGVMAPFYTIGRGLEVLKSKIKGEEPTGLPSGEYFDLLKSYFYAIVTSQFPELQKPKSKLEKIA